MERTQKEKQQAFRQKLHTEGADSFADGPRPWEQWDESGSQHDNRIWEGTARRIHPKHKGASGFGDRLLSGLAVVALASMVVGIAGIYLSTPTTPQQARTLIQPPPIMASRTTTSPATRLVEPADTAAPVLAKLDTLSPPAAGSPVSRVEHKTVLEPTMTAPRSAPVVPSDNIDKVAVETVITEEAVTTTVDTQQLSQDEPELVAMVATTAPPFTHDPTQNDKPSVAIARETARSDQTEVLATEPAIVAQTEVETTTAPSVTEQAEYAASEPAIVEETAETVTAPTIVALAEIVESEPAVTEETAEAVATPTIITQAETVDTEPTVVEETAEAVATPTIVAQAGTVDTEPAVVEETVEAVATPTIVAQAGT
ncbi:MAG: hypothetical protein QNL87_09735, partial [Gammaproteobacteria bacterium]|nr:hypothetical protein [Gammaproteobacteria bacterium]